MASRATPSRARTIPRRADRRRSALRAVALAAALCSPLAWPGAARGAEYDPQKAGNPLKIVYYVLYPVGWTLDVLIFRPAYYIGQCEPFQTVFGTPRHPDPVPPADPD